MKKFTYPVDFKEFKVKKRLWIWLLAILINIIAIRCAVIRVYLVFFVILAVDLMVLPDACHFRYILNDKFLEIKCIIFPTPDIVLSSITKVEIATLMTFRGFGLKIYEETAEAFKISYMDGRRQKNIIVTPKNSNEFIHELSLRVDKNVIVIGNTESAFKKNKNQR